MPGMDCTCEEREALTPKPSNLTFVMFRNERSLVMSQEAVSVCWERRRWMRNRQGYNCTSRSDLVRPHGAPAAAFPFSLLR